MDEGTGKAMFILITIIIFGIFVVIAYWLFEDEIQRMLGNMMDSADRIVTDNLTEVETGAGLTPGGW